MIFHSTKQRKMWVKNYFPWKIIFHGKSFSWKMILHPTKHTLISKLGWQMCYLSPNIFVIVYNLGMESKVATSSVQT